MSRKPNTPDQRVSKNASFNSLIKELEQEDSLINYLPEAIKLAALQVPEELLNNEEEALLTTLKLKYGYEPTNTVEALRNNFWMEFDRVQASKTENVMLMVNVWLGVCNTSYFHRVTVEYPYILAYILTRSPQYEAAQAGLLSLSTRRIRDILSIPIKNAKGEYQDPKLIELVLKAAAMVDLRNRGGYINRSETKNLTMMESRSKTEVTYTGFFDAGAAAGKSVEEIQANIDERLKELIEEEARTTLPLPKPQVQGALAPAIEAEYKEVDQSGERART